MDIAFTVIHCPACHIPFAITSDLYDRLRDCHNGFYCPLGHSMSFGQESELERTRRLRDITIKERDNLIRQRDELAGELAKLKARRKTNAKSKKPPAPRKARQ